MMLRIQCRNPDCRLSFGASEAGKIGRCPSCGSGVDEMIGPDSAIGVAGVDSGVSSPPSSSYGSLGSPWDLPRGSVLGGRYRIERKVGEGGMGAVYLAEDGRLRRMVALKVPHPHLFEGDTSFLERLYREAQIAAKFYSSKICPIYDVDHSGDWHYIVMHFVEGETLAEVMKRRPFDPAEACRLARSVALTLQEAHSRGIIHRDLKPSNLMVGPDDGPIIMDFGLAKWFDGEGEDALKTNDGTFLGTLVYAPPEQIEGLIGELGPGCDIYTLGVILYELLTGRLPFQGSRFLLLEKILKSEPDPPSMHAAGIGPGLDAVVLRAMAKKSADRYSTMTDFAEALDACSARAAGPVAAPSPPEPTPAAGPDILDAGIDGPAYETKGAPDVLVPDLPVGDLDGPDSGFELVPDGREPEPEVGYGEAELAGEYASRSTGMVLVRVAPGEFVMGSADGDPDERPGHRVRITRAFYLGRFAVTRREYEKVVGDRGAGRFRYDPGNPVESVSWLDAVAFCNLLSVRDGFAPFYEIKGRTVTIPDRRIRGYRLPTEAEWEFACRAGRTSRFGFGDDQTKLGAYAWYSANSGQKAHPVGSKRPNAWGLFDMHGNVWEWCWDWYDPQYYQRRASDDPQGPDAERKFRVLRGGHCGEDAENLRSARRRWFEPSIRLRSIGFRLARSAE